MTNQKVNIHTHHPTGTGIELRAAAIHPWEAKGRHASELLPLPQGTQAMGEIGLDFACAVPRHEQMRLLCEQLDMAQELHLPVVLHCVRAFEPLMKELSRYTLRAVIFHGFLGSPEQAQRAVDCGYYLSFGERTFRSPRTVQALRSTPLDRLFCETDESLDTIENIYRQIAEAKGVDEDDLSSAILQNYKRIFDDNNR
ncbi:MAG: TatD family hydrolase [Alistipes sp.]